MENIQRMYTVAKGAEAYELATVISEIQSKEKPRFIFVKIRLTEGHIINTTIYIILVKKALIYSSTYNKKRAY